ncbi:uncharacterized protein LOC141911923 [Tubulanus polymorphus]|uniref:uncharacterized protein LOC141911923 n=1 Tax=Tubulanus polymorphus TaxID=672921 RepID=UPI003DA53EE2
MSFNNIATVSDAFHHQHSSHRHVQLPGSNAPTSVGHLIQSNPALSYPYGGYQITGSEQSSYSFGGGGAPAAAMVGTHSGTENIAPVYHHHHHQGEVYHHHHTSGAAGGGGEMTGAPPWGLSPGYAGQAATPFMQITQHQNALMVANSGRGGRTSKPKRRRVATVAQRRAANIRERRRMFNLNESFDVLRKKVPTFAYEKRLSRIETLRLAITYISFLSEVCEGKDPNDVKLVSPRGSSWAALKKMANSHKLLQDSESGEG